jgi:hypothetical protein
VAACTANRCVFTDVPSCGVPDLGPDLAPPPEPADLAPPSPDLSAGELSIRGGGGCSLAAAAAPDGRDGAACALLAVVVTLAFRLRRRHPE